MLLFSHVYSQSEKEVYYLGCTSLESNNKIDSLKTNLYFIRKDSLILKKTVESSNDDMCTFIRYSDYKKSLFVFLTNINSSHVAKIEFSMPDSIKIFPIGEKTVLLPNWLYFDDKRNLSLLIYGYENSVRRLWSLNICDGDLKEVNESVLKENFYSEGSRTIFSNWTTLYLKRMAKIILLIQLYMVINL